MFGSILLCWQVLKRLNKSIFNLRSPKHAIQRVAIQSPSKRVKRLLFFIYITKQLILCGQYKENVCTDILVWGEKVKED